MSDSDAPLYVYVSLATYAWYPHTQSSSRDMTWAYYMSLFTCESPVSVMSRMPHVTWYLHTWHDWHIHTEEHQNHSSAIMEALLQKSPMSVTYVSRPYVTWGLWVIHSEKTRIIPSRHVTTRGLCTSVMPRMHKPCQNVLYESCQLWVNHPEASCHIWM